MESAYLAVDTPRWKSFREYLRDPPSLRGVGGPPWLGDRAPLYRRETEVCPLLAGLAGARRGHDHVDILRSSTDAVGEQLGGLGVSQPNTEQEVVMADVLADAMDANNRYAASLSERGKLPLPPAGSLPS